MKFAKETREMIRAAKMSGDFIKEAFIGKGVAAEYKDKREIVTSADKKSEQIIIKYITEQFPEHRIVSEESGERGNKKSEYTWYIDPLDGTTNFFYHIPYFNVSIALEHAGEVICGVVYNPLLKEMFYAEKGKGAFLNGRPISPSQNTDMKKAFITSCHGRKDADIALFLRLMRAFKYNAFDMRKLGSAALELCYVACGRSEAFVGVGLKPWDFKAGLLIAQESGCRVGGLGGRISEENNLVVCAPGLYNKVRKIMSKVV